jgi:hypothetical protein
LCIEIFCRRRRMTCLWTWIWRTRIWRRKWALSGIGTFVWTLLCFFKLKVSRGANKLVETGFPASSE